MTRLRKGSSPVPSAPPSYEGPVVTTDCVCFRFLDEALEVLIHRRPAEPFAGKLALPGVYVAKNETILAAAQRCLLRKGGLAPDAIRFRKIIDVYDNLQRDPRGHSVSVIVLSVASATAANSPFVDVRSPPRLAFDHNQILVTSLQWLRDHLWTDGALLHGLLGTQPLTTLHLAALQEAVHGDRTDVSNLRRKILSAGLLRPSARKSLPQGRGRPSATWEWVAKT